MRLSRHTSRHSGERLTSLPGSTSWAELREIRHVVVCRECGPLGRCGRKRAPTMLRREVREPRDLPEDPLTVKWCDRCGFRRPHGSRVDANHCRGPHLRSPRLYSRLCGQPHLPNRVKGPTEFWCQYTPYAAMRRSRTCSSNRRSSDCGARHIVRYVSRKGSPSAPFSASARCASTKRSFRA